MENFNNQLSVHNPRSGGGNKTYEWITIIFFLIMSFINTTALLISMLLLLLLLYQREVGAVKILSLITLRTIINPGIAVGIDQLQYVKWAIIFICSFYLIYSVKKMSPNDLNKLKKIAYIFIIFIIYNIIIAFAISSLPTISMFKLISYSTVFVGVLVGIGITYKSFDWLKWQLQIFQLIIFSSVLIINFPAISYLRNGVSFQGITNQPNMFGIISVLYIGILFAYIQSRKMNIVNMNLQLILAIILISLSNSRTALISVLVVTVIFILLSKINPFLKIFIINISMIIGGGVIYFSNGISVISDFMYKGQTGDSFLASRQTQIENYLSNFLNNPWFGNGFQVPVMQYRSFHFSTEYFVEPGNLIITILSDSGIIGSLIFAIFIARLLLTNKANFRKHIFLFVAVIMINMGEMVFFSSNNIGIWCYMFLALCLFEGASDNQLLKDKMNLYGKKTTISYLKEQEIELNVS